MILIYLVSLNLHIRAASGTSTFMFFQNNIAVDLFLIKKAIVVVRIYCSKYSFMKIGIQAKSAKENASQILFAISSNS